MERIIAISEFVSAAFVCVAFIGQLDRQEKSRESKWLGLGLLATFLYLIIDALAYISNPEWPFAVIYIINLLSYIGGSIALLLYIKYCEIFIGSKASLNPWIFRAATISAVVIAVSNAVLFLCGKLVIYENGVEVDCLDIPLWLWLLYLLTLVYIMVVAVSKQKYIGIKAALLFSSYCIVPSVAVIMAVYTGMDFTVISASVSFCLIYTVLQRYYLNESRQKLQDNLQIINALAGDYGSIYYIDLETEKVTPYSIDESTRAKMTEILKKSGLYSESFKAYVEQFVYEPDREMMFRESSIENITEKLSDCDSRFVSFRMMIGGEISFCEMKYVAAKRENGNVRSIVIGFAHKDNEIMAQYINEKLISEYISAFMVDLDNDKFRIYRHPDTTSSMDRSDRIWSLAMADFAGECDPEYFGLVKNIGNPDFLKKELADTDRREYTYRFPSASKPWRRSVIQVIDRTDGVPTNVVATFMGIDDYQSKINDQQIQLENQQKQLLEVLSRQETRLEQIKGLAAQFSVLYFVNLDTLKTENYYLENAGTPDEAIEIDKKSENFFEAFKSSMIVYAHPDFKEIMLRYAEPEYVRNLLKNTRRHDFRFLCMDASGGYSWTDMVLMKFSESETDEPVNIAVGYYNTDAEMRERLDYARRQERDLEAIRGLANEYDTLYFVDINTDSYSMYYLTEDSPETAKSMVDESIKFSVFHRNSMAAFCHPEYMEMMLRFADMDYVCGLLSEKSKYSCRFLCNSDSGYKWCEFSIIRLDKEDTPERIAVGYINIDEEVKEEIKHRQELSDALAAAEAASRAKTEFLFNMSHDIRTPMNAILGYTDIALKHIDETERVDDSLKKIKTSGGHLLNLINDILEMSRIEAGKFEIINAPLNVYEVTESVASMSQALAATKDITFKSGISNLRNSYIYADELHINQIIINLISNAIKYTNPGGRVEYYINQICDPVNGIARYRITVKDNGIGMSEEFQKHLFESFSREETATVAKQEGAGLGLAIVKRIVDLIGGTVGVQSEKGKGSVFTVELPIEVMNDDEIERYKAENNINSETREDTLLIGKKILLVEDNEMNREIATDILTEAGLIVETAEDGETAVDTVIKNGVDHYDFILMDIQMPVMDGYGATKAIRALPGGDRIPIIALSANAFGEDKLKSLAAGMNAHIAKPIDVKLLFDTMHGLIQNPLP